MKDQYWKRKSLAEMTSQEWEGLCDGCALCCMVKLQDEDTDELYYTDVACRLLNLESCRCSDYENRARRVADCLVLSVDQVETFRWLPDSCAYRRLVFGLDLPDWHPLITGRAESVHEARISVRGRVISETDSDDYNVLRKLS